MSKLPSLQTYFILKQVIYLTIKYSIILHSALVIHAESSKRPSKHLLELILSFNLEKKKNTEVTLKQIPSRVLALSSCHNTWKNLSALAPCRLLRLSCTVTLPHSFVLAQWNSHANHTRRI